MSRTVRDTLVPSHGRVLGLDLGQRRIGVAASDDAQRLAVAVATVAVTRDAGAHRRALRRLVDEYQAVGVVFGLPIGLSGADTASTKRAVAEMTALRPLLGVPTDTVDERFTTRQATGQLKAGGLDQRRARKVVDMTAAAVLLQAWLDTRAGAREEVADVG